MENCMTPIDFKESKISDQITFGNLLVEKQKHLKYEQVIGYKPTIKVLEENALVGIEIEAENIELHPVIDYYWKGKEDNSLRNCGYEYASIPLRMYQVENALDYLNNKLSEDNTPDFSPRTSVHVHINVRDMCWGQIKNFLLLYAIFERHFFYLAGSKRETSVFCVPLYRTKALRNLDTMEYGDKKWHEYSAVNPGTILGNEDVPKFGTIEFRHLYGTLDKKIIINWLNNIMCLRHASRCFTETDLKYKIMDLNTTSEYAALYKNIFGEYADTLLMSKHDFENCISTTKMALWGNNWKHQFSCTANSRFNMAYTQKTKHKVYVPNKVKGPTYDELLDMPVLKVNANPITVEF